MVCAFVPTVCTVVFTAVTAFVAALFIDENMDVDFDVLLLLLLDLEALDLLLLDLEDLPLDELDLLLEPLLPLEELDFLLLFFAKLNTVPLAASPPVNLSYSQSKVGSSDVTLP